MLIMKYLYKVKSKTLAILAASMVTLNSCDIDVIPQDRYAEDVIWSDPKTMEMYINGLYAEFKNFQFGLFPGLGTNNSVDALADALKYTSNVPGIGTVNLMATNASGINPGAVGLNYWATGYSRIRRVNEFLNGLHHKSVVSDSEKLKYEAEAKFIRAYSYFWLAKIHGSVIILKDINEYANKNNPRSSEKDVYDFIIEDLTFAGENLAKTNLSGRATKGSAYALLSRVALHAGSIAQYDKKIYNQDPLTGIPANLAREYFTKASDAGQQVINLANEGLYDFETDFTTIFSKKDTKESIFRIDFAAPNMTHQYDLWFAPPKDDATNNAQVLGVPTAEIVDEFEMEDGTKFSWNNAAHATNPYANREKRFAATILHNGAQWRGRTLNTTPNDNVEGFIPYGEVGNPRRTVTGYYLRKFLDPTNSSFYVNGSTQSWHVLRYAEVLLNVAEAKLHLEDFNGAASLLSTLRSKRGLPAVAFGSLTQGMIAIEHERAVELAFEGHRYWDLRRWRKAHITLNDRKMTGHRIAAAGNSLNYEVVPVDDADREFTTKMYYFPIPAPELTNNTELTQIQGW